MHGSLVRSALVALIGVCWIAPSAADEVTQVDISKLTFTPVEITVHAGDTVQWINKDFVAHTATGKNLSPGQGWDVLVPAHKSAEERFEVPGTIAYYCRFHPNMKATIIVLPR